MWPYKIYLGDFLLGDFVLGGILSGGLCPGDFVRGGNHAEDGGLCRFTTSYCALGLYETMITLLFELLMGSNQTKRLNEIISSYFVNISFITYKTQKVLLQLIDRNASPPD